MTAVEQHAIEGAFFAIFAFGDWRKTTELMTYSQRKVAAEAVERHHLRIKHDGDGMDLSKLRWWES